MSKSTEARRFTADIKNAIRAFHRGGPVLIHDADEREGETDLVYPAGSVTPATVTRLRTDAGGLVCVAVSHEVAAAFDLPFLQDVITHPAAENHDLGYDDRSSFSLPVNHRETYTGITDDDRALTIAKLAEAAMEPQRLTFEQEFRSPGHVHLLRAAPNLLADRQGHTELGVALATIAGMTPAVVVCEMLDDQTGRELPPAKARTYAEKHDVPMLEGSSLVMLDQTPSEFELTPTTPHS